MKHERRWRLHSDGRHCHICDKCEAVWDCPQMWECRRDERSTCPDCLEAEWNENLNR